MNRRDYYHEEDAPAATRIVPAVSAVVRDSTSRIVMHLRADNGYWSLPGGAIEIGETVSEAIIREVREETGYDVLMEGLVGIYSDPRHVIAYADGEVRQQFSVCFSCLIIKGAAAISVESKDVRLFSKEELEGISIHPANRLRLTDFFSLSPKPILR